MLPLPVFNTHPTMTVSLLILILILVTLVLVQSDIGEWGNFFGFIVSYPDFELL